MDKLQQDAISNIFKKFNLTEDEKEFVKYSHTNQTADINHSKVISMIFLTKQIENSTDLLAKQLEELTNKIIESNKTLAEAENKNSEKMQYLTWALSSPRMFLD